jgi:hypothetical protein
MSWLIVRQYRTEILYGAPVFIALLALFALADFNLRNALSDAGLSSCLGQSPLTRACDQAASVVIHDHNWSSSLMPWMNFLPVLIGVMAAAPLVLEFDQRTYRLAWTQGVGRRRWFVQKLVVALLAGAAAAAAITLVISHLYWPMERTEGRWGNTFNLEGTVFVSYTLFAVALAIAIGAVTKRAFPTFVATIVAFLVARISLENMVRPKFLEPLTRDLPLGSSAARRDWTLSERLVQRDGTPVSLLPCNFKSPDCGAANDVFIRLVYHPADRFWLFQGIESAIFLGAALILAAVATWWVTRRLA